MSEVADKIKVEDLKTVPDIRALMTRLSLPNVDDDGLRAVGKVMGQEFRSHLVKMANGDDVDEVSSKSIKKSISLLSPAFKAGLQQVGVDLPANESLVRFGVERCMEIRENLNIALTGDKVKSPVSVQLLKRMLNEPKNGAGEASIPSQPAKNAVRPLNSSNSGSSGRTTQVTETSNTETDDSYVSSEVEQGPNNEYVSVHVYGKQFALCFSASEVKGKKIQTVSVQAAAAKEGKEREFEWKEAINLQFTQKELPAILAVMWNLLPMAEFKSHGVQHDKGFSIERQDGKFFAKCFAAGKGARGVAIPAHEAFILLHLFQVQVLKEMPGYSLQDLNAMLRAVYAPPLQRKQA